MQSWNCVWFVNVLCELNFTILVYIYGAATTTLILYMYNVYGAAATAWPSHTYCMCTPECFILSYNYNTNIYVYGAAATAWPRHILYVYT